MSDSGDEKSICLLWLEASKMEFIITELLSTTLVVDDQLASAFLKEKRKFKVALLYSVSLEIRGSTKLTALDYIQYARTWFPSLRI